MDGSTPTKGKPDPGVPVSTNYATSKDLLTVGVHVDRERDDLEVRNRPVLEHLQLELELFVQPRGHRPASPALGDVTLEVADHLVGAGCEVVEGYERDAGEGELFSGPFRAAGIPVYQ